MGDDKTLFGAIAEGARLAKLEALRGVLEEIERRYGRGTIMKMDAPPDADVGAIPTGCAPLDAALGIGGLARGRLVEVFGPGSGKLVLALHAVAQVQLQGGLAALLDMEHMFDAGVAQKIGVRVDRLLVSQPDCGEQALEIVEMMVRSGAVDLVVVNSTNTLVPKDVVAGEQTCDAQYLQARLLSQAIRKVTGLAHRQGCTLLFVSQTQQGAKLGETGPALNALKFYSSVRIDLREVGQVHRGPHVVGMRYLARVVKNKLAPPFASATFEVIDGGLLHHESGTTTGEETALADASRGTP